MIAEVGALRIINSPRIEHTSLVPQGNAIDSSDNGRIRSDTQTQKKLTFGSADVWSMTSFDRLQRLGYFELACRLRLPHGIRIAARPGSPYNPTRLCYNGADTGETCEGGSLRKLCPLTTKCECWEGQYAVCEVARTDHTALIAKHQSDKSGPRTEGPRAEAASWTEEISISSSTCIPQPHFVRHLSPHSFCVQLFFVFDLGLGPYAEESSTNTGHLF